jgi:RHS repeat-associated protein
MNENFMNRANRMGKAVPATVLGLCLVGMAHAGYWEFIEESSNSSSHRTCANQDESGSGQPSCLSEGSHWYSHTVWQQVWSPGEETESEQGHEWCPGLGKGRGRPLNFCGDQPVYRATTTTVHGTCVWVPTECSGICPTGTCGDGSGEGGSNIPNVTPTSSGLYGSNGSGTPLQDECEVGAQNCSVRLTFSLGRNAEGKKIGYLLVSQPKPSPVLSSPGCLELVGEDLQGTIVLRNPNYSIRQILTHNQLLDITVLDDASWQVAFYVRPAEIQRDASGWVQPVGTPRRTSKLSRADETNLTFLDRIGTRERRYDYLWKGDEVGWALAADGAGHYVLSRRSENIADHTHERVKEHFSLDDRLLKRERWVYRRFPFGEFPIRYEIGDGEAIRWSHIEYYEDAAEKTSYGRVKAHLESDGSWKNFLYGEDGLSTVVIEPWKDSPPTMRPEEARSSEVSYRNLRPGEEFYYPGAIVQQRTDSILGIAVRRDFSLRGNLPTGERFEVIERASSPEAKFGDPTNLRNEYRYHAKREEDPASDQLASIKQADGTTTLYHYESGHYDGEGGIPGEFVPAYGAPWLRVSETSVPTAVLEGIPGRTLRTSAIYTRDQRQVLSETSVLVAVGEEPVWETLDWTTSTYDDRNRLAQRRSVTGIQDEFRYNDCCGKLEWQRDADGTETSYVHDALNRRIATIRQNPGLVPVETHYNFDELGRGNGETVIAGDLKQKTGRTLDVFGRVLESTAVDGLVTRHQYDEANHTSTTMLPGGATRVDHRYRDGQSKAVTGTSVVAQYYDYGVNPANGDRWNQTSLAKADGPRWSRSVVDALDRNVLSERPGHGEGVVLASHTAYDKHGRAVATQSAVTTTTQGGADQAASQPLGRAALMSYHPTTGELLLQGEDTDGNGRLEPGKDRVARESTRIEQIEGHWWQVTRQWTYPLASQGQPVLVSEQRQRLSGLGKQHEDPTFGVLVSETVQIVPAADELQPQKGAEDTKTVNTRSLTYRNRDTATTITVSDGPTGRRTRQVAVAGQVRTSADIELTDAGERVCCEHHFTYDALGRPVSTTDPRTGESKTVYDPTTSQVTAQVDPAGNVTRYAYYPAEHENAGKLAFTANAAGKQSHVAYTPRGEQRSIWGDSTQPLVYEYNEYGEMVGLKTFHTLPNGDPGLEEDQGARTAWHYHEATGSLLKKEYADGHGPEYTYNEAGQLKSRTWARESPLADSGLADSQKQGAHLPGRLTTTYEYDPNSLQLIRSQTANSKIATSYQYNPDGQLVKVTDATGSRELTYDPRGQVIKESVTLTTGENTPPITYEINRAYTKLGQPASVHLVSDSDNFKPGTLNLKLDHEVAYEWNNHGQLSKVKSLAGEFVYEYDATSPTLLTKMTGPVHEVTTTYEPHRNLITSVTNRARDQELKTENSELKTSPPISSYTYANDILGRRETISQGGEAFAMLKLGANTVDVAYNDRSEVIGATIRRGDTLLARHQYDYDVIGNRKTAQSAVGFSPVGGEQTTEVRYESNALNQYTAIEIDPRQLGEGVVSAKPHHDLDGNLIEDAKNRYTWDADNRLIRVDAKDGSKRVTYTYDCQSRRTSRTEINQAGTKNEEQRTSYYLYDDWNLLAELRATSGQEGLGTLDFEPPTLYSWGRDLSGSLQGAGGVGGLLAITDRRGNRYPAYDANGNVGLLVDEKINAVAAYFYDPFGNMIEMAGDEASGNSWRFSTKPVDEGTGWLYYGYRYYSPQIGRWLSKDPVEEMGGINTYAYARNNPLNAVDYLGLSSDIELHFVRVALKGAGNWDPGALMPGQSESFGNWTSNVFRSGPQYEPVKNAMNEIKSAFGLPILDEENDRTKCKRFFVMVAGYSWGGWMALKLANKISTDEDFKDLDISVYLGLLDPVSTGRDSNWGRVPHVVAGGVNYYQTNGCPRCVSPFGITLIPGAAFQSQPINGITNFDKSSEPGDHPNGNIDHANMMIFGTSVIDYLEAKENEIRNNN